MPFDLVEERKRQYTDKYVVVDSAQPELARFKDLVGQVKTVNMSGRALVEFMDYHLNIGWYDIDPAYLKVVDKPPPKVEKPPAKKPAAKAEAKPAAAKPAAAKAPAAGAKASVADILAAARAGKAGAAKSAGEAASGEAASAAGTAKAKSAAPAPKPAAPVKLDRSKMSVAEMLAAARAGGAGGVVQAKIQSESPPDADALPPAGEPASAAGKQPTESIVTPTAKVDRSKMTIDDILAWCRAHDAK